VTIASRVCGKFSKVLLDFYVYMESIRDAQRKKGIKCPGPVERLRTALCRERDRIRQEECRKWKRLAAACQKWSTKEQIPNKPTPARVAARSRLVN
jgi:hypothetical protein